MTSPTKRRPSSDRAESELSANGNEPADDAVIGRAFRWSALLLLGFGLIAAGGWWARTWFKPEAVKQVVQPSMPTVRDTTNVSIPNLPLVDITRQSGVDFVHHTGATGEKLLPETMGSGVGLFDYDNDGDVDLLFVDGRDWPWTTGGKAGGQPRLYANDGNASFTEVTEAAGMPSGIYGMGLAIGDYDNDGWTDVFLSAVGSNRLLHNEQGKFVDRTAEAGVAGAEDSWSTSTAFIDFDRDGLLDLFVANYVQWSRDIDREQSFTLDGRNRAYGPPRAFAGTFPYLYHNLGNGQFADVSASAGVQVVNPDTHVPLAKGMGIAPLDVDGDGWIDVAVANDTVQNFLFVNQHDGTFKESAKPLGIAYDRTGGARGAMGIDCNVIRPDGTLAIGIGNFANEMSALYVAAPKRRTFIDAATATGFGPPTRLSLTFGLLFFDLDLDGRPEILGCNGHLEPEISQFQASQTYAQPPQLFWNAGTGSKSEFVLVPEEKTGRDFSGAMVGRGAAFGDLDGDGDVDIVLTANGSAPRVLRNDQSTGHHWLRVRLVGRASNRSGIGATIKLHAGGDTQVRFVTATRGYLSQSELTQTFGLGKLIQVDKVEILWPNGQTQEILTPAIDQVLEVKEPEESVAAR
jgi:hypothetical protein